MSRIASALDAKQRPTVALLEDGDPYSGWTSFDYRLQEAYFVYKNEICQKCNNPVWLCHSADNRIDFIVKKGACYGQAEIEDHEKDENNKLASGEYFYAVAVGIENEDGTRDPLPSRAEARMKMV